MSIPGPASSRLPAGAGAPAGSESSSLPAGAVGAGQNGPVHLVRAAEGAHPGLASARLPPGAVRAEGWLSAQLNGAAARGPDPDWVRYVEQLWLATPDGGLCAALLGPSTVTARVGWGVEVTVTEETDYPVGDTATFRLRAPSAVGFPFVARIPDWCLDPELRINGAIVSAGPGPMDVRVHRTWRDGDTITLRLRMRPSLGAWPRTPLLPIRDIEPGGPVTATAVPSSPEPGGPVAMAAAPAAPGRSVRGLDPGVPVALPPLADSAHGLEPGTPTTVTAAAARRTTTTGPPATSGGPCPSDQSGS